ncbi:MAG: hypothetical protein V4525_07920 [Pseudomonadota bacterium]
MNPIIVSNLNTISDIESAISKVNNNIGAGLQLQKDSVNKRKGAMHDASRLQFLVTWARANPDSYLHFHPANNMESVLSEMCNYAPGIAALRMSDGIKIGNDVISRREALQRATEKMEHTDSQDFPKIIKGRSIDITCVSGAKLQYLRPLFTSRSPDAVKDKNGMHIFLQSLMNYINKKDMPLISNDFLKACSIFTKELFENTQEHAVQDHKGVPYITHVEGLIASWLNMEESEYASDFQGHEKLKDFWEREAEQSSSSRGSEKSLRCFQLSFFDSGPGFASRITGCKSTELERDEERKNLISCLQKNFTTKRQIGAGQGLPGVLVSLKEIGGLIRIRSGRYSIFNCFKFNEDEDIFSFNDWTEEPLDTVAGVVISLIIPLRRK